jgi:hypothetical protein
VRARCTDDARQRLAFVITCEETGRLTAAFRRTLPEDALFNAVFPAILRETRLLLVGCQLALDWHTSAYASMTWLDDPLGLAEKLGIVHPHDKERMFGTSFLDNDQKRTVEHIMSR